MVLIMTIKSRRVFLFLALISALIIFLLSQFNFSAIDAVVSAQTPDSTPDEVLEDGTMITDGLLHSVPLEDIIFDDFDIPSRSRPLTNATQDDIERLRDRIPPICDGELEGCVPLNYEDVATADAWMNDNMTIFGYIANDGQTYAYPFNILNFHEIVNDTLADVPVLISYCPLCNSAIVYSRILNGQELVFGNTSALYNSNMVMYDSATDSFWFQVEGRAIVGELTGEVLDLLPGVTTSWGDWKADHPDTLVLARPRNSASYSRDVFANYSSNINRGQFFFPVDSDVLADIRLQAGDTVLLVESGEEAIAYPLEALGDSATQDTIGEEAIVVLSLADTPSGVAYFARTDDSIEVNLLYDDGVWRDTLSNSTFNFSGEAISGILEGQSLVPFPARYTYWFAAVATAPDVVVYSPEN